METPRGSIQPNFRRLREGFLKEVIIYEKGSEMRELEEGGKVGINGIGKLAVEW